MSLSITGGNGGGFSPRGLQQAQERLDRTSAQLSSGKRIARAADDAAGAAIALRMLAQERSYDVGERNLEDGEAMADTAEGALQSTHEALGRMRELTVQAQNGTLGDEDRAALQQEYDQLAAQVSQVAEGTRLGERPLLDGSLTAGTAITDGQNGATDVQVDDQSAQALGIEGLDAAQPTTLAAIDRAIDRVSSSRARLGATTSELQSRVRQDRVTAENTAAARSRIEDVDVAYATALQTRDELLRNQNVLLQAYSQKTEQRSALHLLA